MGRPSRATVTVPIAANAVFATTISIAMIAEMMARAKSAAMTVVKETATQDRSAATMDGATIGAIEGIAVIGAIADIKAIAAIAATGMFAIIVTMTAMIGTSGTMIGTAIMAPIGVTIAMITIRAGMFIMAIGTPSATSKTIGTHTGIVM